MGLGAPLTSTIPLSMNSASKLDSWGCARLWAAAVTWMQPGGQHVSVRDAMLTVSPNRQKRRRILPTIPDITGPLWTPGGE